MALGKLTRKARRATKDAARKARASAKKNHGPSPNPMTNLAIADIALRTGTMLARRSVERSILGAKYTPKKAKAILKGRSITETLLHTAVAKIATRSVPGAIVVGGGMLAKTLYDRRRGRRAEVEGEVAMQKRAEEGTD